MPDNWRFSEAEIEQGLKDLGAGIEYPPTPDVARAVRLRLDEEEQARRPRRPLYWLPFLTARWTAVALPRWFWFPSSRSLRRSAPRSRISSSPASSTVRKPKGPPPDPRAVCRRTAPGRRRARLRTPQGLPSRARERGLRVALPRLPKPNRPVPLPERGFGSMVTTSPQAVTRAGSRPQTGSESTFGKASKPGSSRSSTQTVASPSMPGCASRPVPNRDRRACGRQPVPASVWRRASWSFDDYRDSGFRSYPPSRRVRRRCTPSSSSVT
jgi:hypothetical protein